MGESEQVADRWRQRGPRWRALSWDLGAALPERVGLDMETLTECWSLTEPKGLDSGSALLWWAQTYLMKYASNPMDVSRNQPVYVAKALQCQPRDLLGY